MAEITIKIANNEQIKIKVTKEEDPLERLLKDVMREGVNQDDYSDEEHNVFCKKIQTQ